MSILQYVYIENILSRSMTYFFTFSVMYFAENNSLVLMMLHLSIFPLSSVICILPKKFFLPPVLADVFLCYLLEAPNQSEIIKYKL